MANLLKNGDINRHLKKSNKIYHERRDVLARLLNERLGDNISFKLPDGGFAIWVQYLNHIRADKVAEKAAEMGLSISNGTGYFNDDRCRHSFVRLGFASLNSKELEDGVGILEKAVRKVL